MELKYYLLDVLETEKNITDNLAIALNEASNMKLYKTFLKMFENVSLESKKLFQIANDLGFYQIEYAPKTKVEKAIKKIKQS